MLSCSEALRARQGAALAPRSGPGHGPLLPQCGSRSRGPPAPALTHSSVPQLMALPALGGCRCPLAVSTGLRRGRARRCEWSGRNRHPSPPLPPHRAAKWPGRRGAGGERLTAPGCAGAEPPRLARGGGRVPQEERRRGPGREGRAGPRERAYRGKGIGGEKGVNGEKGIGEEEGGQWGTRIRGEKGIGEGQGGQWGTGIRREKGVNRERGFAGKRGSVGEKEVNGEKGIGGERGSAEKMRSVGEKRVSGERGSVGSGDPRGAAVSEERRQCGRGDRWGAGSHREQAVAGEWGQWGSGDH